MMNPEFFRITATSRGYDILYRGTSIGGAESDKAPKGSAAIRKHTADNRKSAELEVSYLLAGAGRQSMQEQIKKIDKEYAQKNG